MMTEVTNTGSLCLCGSAY